MVRLLRFNTFRSFLNMSGNSRLQLLHQHLSIKPHRCVATDSRASQFGEPTIVSVDVGSKYSATYRKYAADDTGKILSYFHDVPLGFDASTKTANMVVEVPRWSNAKFEISTELDGNPIVQDVKNNVVRFVRNLFPYHGYIHNYGAFPQTWEDNTTKHKDTGLYGDNDPLDVCEIGSNVLEIGTVKRVKILGCLALIDDGELDWKVIVIDVEDELAPQLNSIEDVESVCPGLLEGTRQWFRDYKLADKKPHNKFAFNGRYLLAEEALEVVGECHSAWEKLIGGEVKSKGDEISLRNTTQKETPEYAPEFSQEELISPAMPDTAIPPEISKSHFFPRS